MASDIKRGRGYRSRGHALPTGVVTFLFTDIEGSTRLWETCPEAMAHAVARHDLLIRKAIAASGGSVFKTGGDSFCAAFPEAPSAVAAALAGQILISQEPWPGGTPLRVRMAMHSGLTQERDGDYFGSVLNRAARLLSAAHGGQTLVSQATRELAREHLPLGATLRELGVCRLKDLTHPERIFQLVHLDLADAFPALRTLETVPNNLPQQVTRFIGREKEMQKTRDLLAQTPLLTLVGTGGTGKTRLCLQVASEVLDEYPEGVWFVELAALSDASLVAQTVASVLGVREQTEQTITQVLAARLKEKKLLLLIDNCEHLLAACAQLVAALLPACSGVRVLVTSREPLGIAGEQIYRVPSLSLPDSAAAGRVTPRSLLSSEAVRLFVERAQAVKPDWAVTDAGAPVLARVCSRLDGIPLALELVAARVRSLSLEEINDRLDHRFRLLTGGNRAALPRQQTLQALVDWSYGLLNEREKTLFTRLSVFASGWTLEAAEAVCSDGAASPGTPLIEEWEVLDLLTGLVDKSLVLAEENEGATRYRMLHTLRQYGAEKLVLHGQAGEVKYRHLRCFVALAEEAEPKLIGPEQATWLNRLETEHDNIRAALACRVDPPNDAAPDSDSLTLRLVGAVWRFWDVRGYLAEGREQMVRVLERMPEGNDNRGHWNYRDLTDPGARAKVLYGSGVLAMSQADFAASQKLLHETLSLLRPLGDNLEIARVLTSLGAAALNQGDCATAKPFYEESLAIRRATENKPGIVSSLNSLGNIARAEGNLVRARTLYEECCKLCRERGDKHGRAVSTHNLSLVVSEQGDLAEARSLLEQSLAFYREINDKNGVANALNDIGFVLCAQKDPVAARSLFEVSLILYGELGNQVGVAISLEGLAWTLLDREKPLPYFAVVVWAACSAFRERVGVLPPPRDQIRYRARLEKARQALGEAAYLAAWAEGHSLSLDSVLDFLTNAGQGSYEQHRDCLTYIQSALGENAFSAAWNEGSSLSIEQVIEVALANTEGE